MDQKALIQDSFWAICVNMQLKDYEEASAIAGYLACFQEEMTETQLEQLILTFHRLDYIASKQGNTDADEST
jgi:hypothetical protein